MHDKEVFNLLKTKKIIVVGDIMLDRYLYGEVERISPEAPVPVLMFKKENFTPGGAANVTLNLTGLNIKTSLFGVIGEDDEGKRLLNLLTQIKNLSVKGVLIDKDRPTTVKQRIVGNNQQIVRIDRESRIPLRKKILQKLKDLILKEKEDISAVILSDYGKGVISKEMIQFILELKKKNKFIVSVDPKVGHFFHYKYVDLITPNQKETEDATGLKIEDNKSLKKASKQLINRLKCKNLLVTLGAAGMILFNKENPQGYHIPAEAKEVYDVSGAGDTVISVMTAAMATGASPAKSARLANIAAGIVVGEFGTTAITIEKLKKKL